MHIICLSLFPACFLLVVMGWVGGGGERKNSRQTDTPSSWANRLDRVTLAQREREGERERERERETETETETEGGRESETDRQTDKETDIQTEDRAKVASFENLAPQTQKQAKATLRFYLKSFHISDIRLREERIFQNAA